MLFLEFYQSVLRKNKKILIYFFFILLVSLSILIADILSIFSILPFTSLTTETGVNFNQDDAYIRYLPKNLKNFIDQLTLDKLLLVLVTVLLTRNLLNLLNNFLLFKFSKYLEVLTSRKIFFLWLNKSYLEFYKKTSSQLIKDFRDSIGGYLMYIDNVIRFFLDIVNIILFISILLILSFKETSLLILFFVIIFIGFNKLVSNFSYNYGKITNKVSNDINLLIINTYKNFSQIVLRKLQKSFLDLISNKVTSFSHSRLIISLIRSNTKYIFEIFIIIFIIFISLTLKFYENYSLKEIVALATIYFIAGYRILPLINNLVSSKIKIKNFKYSFSIIDKQICFFDNQYKYVRFPKKKSEQNNFKNNIKLQNIYFRYEGSDFNIFEKLNLNIHQNEILGIIGKSGSGKTTLIKILLGLINPTKGNILIDDRILEIDEIEIYQDIFSYLSQENLFINGSIKQNIAFGQSVVNEQKIYKALEITNCLEFVEKLTDKINHEITEDGKNFSIGQLQRLALARAIYFENQVLILDEPTSALDETSEKKFLELINKIKHNKTIIIISHKKETLKSCDNIYEIQDKKLVKANIT